MIFAFIFHGYSAMFVSFRGRVGRFSRSAKVQKLPASRSSSKLSAHQMAPSGVIANWRGRRALEPMEIISSRPTASSLYSPWGWRFTPSSTTLDFFVALPSFALSSFFWDSLFSYVRLMPRFYGVWLRWYPVIPGCFPTAFVYLHMYTTANEFLFDSFGGVVSMTVHFFPGLFEWVLIKIVWFLVEPFGSEVLTQTHQLKLEVQGA